MLKLTLRSLRQHLLRFVATTLAVVISVGFMVGVQVLGATVRGSFDEAFADVNRTIDAVVRSSEEVASPFGAERLPVDATVVDELVGVDGVVAAEGQVGSFVRVIGRDGRPLSDASSGPPTFGLNWLTQPALNGWTLTEGRAPGAADEIVLDRRSATDGAFALGDEVVIDLAIGPTPFTLVGIARFGEFDTFAGAPAVLFETAAAQQYLGEPGRFDLIAVAGAEGLTQANLVAALAPALPPGTQALTGEAFTEESAGPFREFIDQFTAFISGFGIIALCVGGFIIFITFAVLVAQRTRELALLRAIGASRRQVMRSVIGEAAVVGVMAASTGVVVGIGLALGLRWLLARLDLELPTDALVLEPVALVWPALAAVGVTLLSAIIPARRAARIAPVAAMSTAHHDPAGQSWRRLGFGSAMVVASYLLVVAGQAREGERAFQLIGGGLICSFVAVIALGPLLIRPLAGLLGSPARRLAGITGQLATENARRNPSRTAATAGALAIGVALVVITALAAASASASISSATERAFTGDLIVTSDTFGGFSPSLAAEVAEVEGVAVATGFRFGLVEVEGDGRPILAVDPVAVSALVDFDELAGSVAALTDDGVAISSQQATRRSLDLGDTITVRFPSTGNQSFVVEAVYEDASVGRGGGFLLTHQAFDTNTPESAQVDRQVVIALASDANPITTRAAIQEIVDRYPTTLLADVRELAENRAGQVDQAVAFLYALLFLAVLIALIGVVNTLLLSVYERTSELGLFRAVGGLRGQVRSMIVQESILIALVGTTIGIGIGALFGRILYDQLSAASPAFSVFEVPAGQLAVIIVSGATAGVLAGLYPAWRASRLDVLDAIATE